MTIREFIGEKAVPDIDGGSGYIFGLRKDGAMQMIAEVRGWGAIQNLFINKAKTHVDFTSAEKFQDALSQFIADAITEKLQRENP